MEDNTTTHDGSIFNFEEKEPNTDVDSASNEQQNESDSQDSQKQDDVAKGFNKGFTKVNQKLSAQDQSLKDMAMLNSYVLRDMSADDIKLQDPELAARLGKMEQFASTFASEEPTLSEEERVEKLLDEKLSKKDLEARKDDAIGNLIVKGKRLSSSDRQLLKTNEVFMKKFNALVNGGFDPSEAVEDAFSDAFPKLKPKVTGSVLSARSEQFEDSSEPKLDAKNQTFADSFRAQSSRSKKRAKR